MVKRDPVSEYLAAIGRKGGQAKVPKGLARMSPEKLAEVLALAAAARERSQAKRKNARQAARVPGTPKKKK